MQYLMELWYEGRHRVLLYLFSPLSGLFRVIVFLRRKLRAAQKLKTLPLVVVVGNITVGGTGKTPVLIALARFLSQEGFSVGVISRGYKSLAAKSNTAILLDAQTSAVEVGDEPCLIYHETKVPVAVHPKRMLALQLLAQQFKLDVILSDDGLQHYALPRTLELVLIDAKRQLGNGFCLPMGPLREPKSRLHTVDFILMNQGEMASANEMAYTEACPDKHYDFYVQPKALIQISARKERQSLAYLRGLRCHAVAGIANPERFFATLTRLGADIIPHAFPDHHAFSFDDFMFEESLPIIMTQKDAVKCEAFKLHEAYALEVSAMLPAKFLRAFLKKLGYNSPSFASRCAAYESKSIGASSLPHFENGFDL